jgi:hypothetical protein
VKAGAGKNKGSAFERSVCQKLSMWISQDKHDDLFWRSSMSGGRATVMFKKGGENRTQCGDITAIHPDGNPLTDKFLISCKFYRDLKIAGAVLGNKGGLSAFWAECVEEAKNHKKLPLLIAKQNQIPPIACLSSAGMAQLGISKKYIVSLPLSGGMYIMWLEKFLISAIRPNTPSRPHIRTRA